MEAADATFVTTPMSMLARVVEVRAFLPTQTAVLSRHTTTGQMVWVVAEQGQTAQASRQVAGQQATEEMVFLSSDMR